MVAGPGQSAPLSLHARPCPAPPPTRRQGTFHARRVARHPGAGRSGRVKRGDARISLLRQRPQCRRSVVSRTPGRNRSSSAVRTAMRSLRPRTSGRRPATRDDGARSHLTGRCCASVFVPRCRSSGRRNGDPRFRFLRPQGLWGLRKVLCVWVSAFAGQRSLRRDSLRSVAVLERGRGRRSRPSRSSPKASEGWKWVRLRGLRPASARQPSLCRSAPAGTWPAEPAWPKLAEGERRLAGCQGRFSTLARALGVRVWGVSIPS